MNVVYRGRLTLCEEFRDLEEVGGVENLTHYSDFGRSLNKESLVITVLFLFSFYLFYREKQSKENLTQTHVKIILFNNVTVGYTNYL